MPKERIPNSRAVNVNGNVDSGSSIQRDSFFLKKYQSIVLEITVLHQTRQLELNVLKVIRKFNTTGSFFDIVNI